MRTIKLYGELAEKFTKEETFYNVNSIPQVMSLLNANYKGFYNYLANYTPGFYLKIGDIYRAEDEVHNPIGEKDTIHLIPVVSGSGKVGLIVAGLALMWATGGLAGMQGLTGAGGLFTAGSTAATMVGSIGMGLVLNGISAVLFAPPKAPPSTEAVKNENKYFNGVVNTVGQGNPVSIGYGRLLIGSNTISAGITTDSFYTAKEDWFFTSIGQNGWTTTADPNVHYNTITKISWHVNDEVYRWSKQVTTTPADYGISCSINYDWYPNKEVCYTVDSDGNSTSVARPPSIKNITYSYDVHTTIYTCIVGCTTNTNFSNSNYANQLVGDIYCRTGGSKLPPTGWGT